MSFCSTKKKSFLIGFRGRHQNDWKESAYDCHVGKIDETPESWQINFVSWSRFFFFLDTLYGMKTERNYYRGVQQDVRITNFCWNNWKIIRMGKTSRQDCVIVLRHGRTCSKMHWKILRTDEQRDKAVIHSLQSLLGWSSFQERWTWISWRIVRSLPTDCVEMFVLDTFGWLDILWLVNKLTRSVVWTKACDRRYARLISDIHDTSDCRQYCRVGNTTQRCRFGLFQLWGLKINLGWNLMYLWKSNWPLRCLLSIQRLACETVNCLTVELRVLTIINPSHFTIPICSWNHVSSFVKN